MGWNRRSLPFPLLLVAGLLIYWRWQGLDPVKEEMAVFIAFGLAPMGGFALLLMLWNMVRMPPKMEEEARQVSGNRISVLEIAYQQVLAERDAQQLDAGKTPQQALKAQLLELLIEGRELEQRCLAERNLPYAPAENWRRRTRDLLEGHVQKQIADIWDEPSIDPRPASAVNKGPLSPGYRELWERIGARVRRLENILNGFED